MTFQMNAALVQDRETLLVYALHTDTCERAFQDALEAAEVNVLARIAPMGPTRLEDTKACNWHACPNNERTPS